MKNKALKIIAFIVIISTVCCFFASAAESSNGILDVIADKAANAVAVIPDFPITGTDEPITGTDETITGTDEPITGTDESVTGTDEPSTGTDEPAEEEGFFANIINTIVNSLRSIVDFILNFFR